MMYRILGIFVVLGIGFGITNAAQVVLEPEFADARFAPANAFHAGCIHRVNLLLKTEKDGVNGFRLVFSYDSKMVQVTNIKISPEFKDVLDSRIEDDKVIFTLLDTPLAVDQQISLAQIVLKTSEDQESNSSLTGTEFIINSPSYLLTK